MNVSVLSLRCRRDRKLRKGRIGAEVL